MATASDRRWVKEVRDLAAETSTPTIAGLILLAVLVSLSARISNLSFIENSMFYEDGIIFVNQSYELGLKSLWIPYAGYQTLFNRIVALLAAQVPLEATPFIFFFAWLLSFLSIVYVLMIRGRDAGLTNTSIMYLLCAIALQPSHGSTYFNLNHSHFFFGIALALYICIPCARRVSIPERLFLLLASLTGPFSAFLIPVIVLQFAILRDFTARRMMYLIVIACGLVQSIYMLEARRISHATVDRDPAHWFNAISSLLTFGGSNKLTYISAAVFWSIAMVYVCRWARRTVSNTGSARSLCPLFAAVVAVIAFAAGAVTTGGYLPLMTPLDWGARYFLVPYSLLFFVVLTTTASDWRVHTAAIVLLAVICAAGFAPVDRADRGGSTGLISYDNLQWIAFAKFQKLKPDILIPINSSLPMYPPPHVHISGVRVVGEPKQGILLEHMQNSGMVDSSGAMDDRVQEENGREYVFNVMNHCEGYQYLAVEIDIWRSRMGWAAVYWGTQADFSSDRSLRRFYPSGSALMQFAFRRDASDYLLRLDPVEGVPDSAAVRTLNSGGWKNIGRIWKGHGKTIGEPTPPGGEMRVHQVRLFCLS